MFEPPKPSKAAGSTAIRVRVSGDPGRAAFADIVLMLRVLASIAGCLRRAPPESGWSM